MYLQHFGLNEKPFSIAPDPRYLYMSEQHQEALAHLLFGLNGEGGIVLLTGEVGTGKTTMVRRLLEDLPDNSNLAWIINPKLSAIELLAAMCDEVGIDYPENTTSIKRFTDLISQYLLTAHAQGRNTILMIDEAQNLSPDVLEQLRLLTNLETSERKLLQIILIGQPELQAILARHDLRQFAQRITARFHLRPIQRHEILAYLEHRLSVAGTTHDIFTPRTARLIHKLSEGLPRRINLFCDRALLGAYATGHTQVQKKHIKQACIEVLGSDSTASQASQTTRPAYWYGLLASLAIATGLFFINIEHIPTSIAKLAKQTVSQQRIPPASEPSKAAHKLAANIIEATPPAHDIWAEISQQGTQATALQTLAAQWGVEFANLPSNNIAACKQLSFQGLQCLRIRDELSRLRDLDRPAMIRIASTSGKDSFITLTALHGDVATVQLNKQTWHVSTQALLQHWYADFMILWQPPKGYTEPIRRHASGSIVTSLAGLLNQVQGEMIPAHHFTRMEPLLVARVKDFQRSVGLNPDGTAGANTLIYLNDATHMPRPHLTPPQASQTSDHMLPETVEQH